MRSERGRNNILTALGLATAAAVVALSFSGAPRDARELVIADAPAQGASANTDRSTSTPRYALATQR